MSPAQEQTALDLLASKDYWRPLMREQPVFINGEGPFLFRGERLMPISLRTAWALLRSGCTADDGRPILFPTYSSERVTNEVVRGMSDHIDC